MVTVVSSGCGSQELSRQEWHRVAEASNAVLRFCHRVRRYNAVGVAPKVAVDTLIRIADAKPKAEFTPGTDMVAVLDEAAADFENGCSPPDGRRLRGAAEDLQ